MGVTNKPFRTREALDDIFKNVKTFAERQTRGLLVVHHDEAERHRLAGLLGGGDVEMTAAGTAADAMSALQNGSFNAVVLDPHLPDATLHEFLEQLRREPSLKELPVIVYSPGEVGKKLEGQLKRLTQSSVVLDVRSPQRLLDETALFLHRPLPRLAEDKRDMLHRLHSDDSILAGKRVLIVDDDIRNIFAMTSILEPHQMQILSAENGKDAIEMLQQHPDVDVVLMDIMMPDMDGYDTMRTIRRLSRFRSLPIVALTAKAMKGDREKCIEAGASDYIAKPVDTEQLLTMLRAWLYR